MTVVGIRGCFEVLDSPQSPMYMGWFDTGRMQLAPLSIAPDGTLGDTTLLFVAPYQYWTGP